MTDEPPTTAAVRYDALDALRACAMLGGVILHGAVAYMVGTMRGLPWPIHEPAAHETFDLIFWWLHAFRIPLFFVVAGFFAALLLERRGLNGFLAHRARRILLPYLLAIVLVLIPTFYVFAAGWWLSDRVTLDEILRWSFYDPGIRSALYGPAHLWFLADLFALSVLSWITITALGEPARRWLSGRSAKRWPAAPWRSLLPVLPSALVLWAKPEIVYAFENGFVPDPLGLAYYATFFAVGLWLYRFRGRLDDLRRGSLIDLTIGTAAFALSWWLWRRGAAESALLPVLALVTALTAWAYTFGFLGLFVRVFATPRPAFRFVSDASYWIYLVHLPLVAVFQIALYERPIDPIIKFAIVVGATSAIGLLTYRGFVRYTVVGTLLNGPRCREVRGSRTRPVPGFSVSPES